METETLSSTTELNQETVQTKANELVQKIENLNVSGKPYTIMLGGFSFGGSEEVWWGECLEDVENHHERVITQPIPPGLQTYEQQELLITTLQNILGVKKRGASRYTEYNKGAFEGSPVYKIHDVWKTKLPKVYWHFIEVGYDAGAPNVNAITINEDYSKKVNKPIKEAIWNGLRFIAKGL